MKQAFVLMTCDIHTHTYSAGMVHRDLQQARSILSEIGLPCTFFFPLRSAETLGRDVDALQRDGHEIGCHGLTHEAGEQYSQLPLEEQRNLLTQATGGLTEILGERPKSFRAPAFKVSGHTMRVLDELGYQADLSINSQRLGALGSDIYNFGPLLAPRRPYHPSWNNPYRKGDAQLWEIPVSAWILPFVSNTERLLGLRFMRCFFQFLYREALTTRKPIVFVFHAEDLNAARGMEERSRLTWRHFLPSSTYGFAFRYFLLERSWRRIQEDLIELFRYMSSFHRVRFLTVKEYLDTLRREF